MKSLLFDPSFLTFKSDAIVPKGEHLDPTFISYVKTELHEQLEKAEMDRLRHLTHFRFRFFISVTLLLVTLFYAFMYVFGDVMDVHSFKHTLTLLSPTYQVWYLNSPEWMKWMLPEKLPPILRIYPPFLLLLITAGCMWWCLSALMSYRITLRQILFIPTFRFKAPFYQTARQRLPYDRYNELFALPSYDRVVKRAALARVYQGAVMTLVETKLLKRKKVENDFFPTIKYAPTFKGFFIWIDLRSPRMGLPPLKDHMIIVGKDPTKPHFEEILKPHGIQLPEIMLGADVKELRICSLNDALAHAIVRSPVCDSLEQIMHANRHKRHYSLDDRLLDKLHSKWLDIESLPENHPISQLPHIVLKDDQIFCTIPREKDLFPSLSPFEPLIHESDFYFIFGVIDAIHNLVDVVREYQSTIRKS